MPDGAPRKTLYELLPAVYREQDAERGEPLRALLAIIQEQADLLDADIERLWRNLFVETCDPWVLPYIGDLVGTTPLFDTSRVADFERVQARFPDLTGPSLRPPIAIRNRTDVAKTIYYRRRKGTLPMLEELARDVTGWAAHAVEFFQLLGWTQCVRNHLRPARVAAPDLRRVERVDRLNGPFDDTAHNVDVRPIGQRDGWYNIRNIGFFLWRLQSLLAENVSARRVGAAGDFRYTFSPLGNPAPLFTHLRREGDEAGLAGEIHVPGPIRAPAFYEDLQAYQALPIPRPGYTEYYGLIDELTGAANPLGLPQAPDASITILRDGVMVPPDLVTCTDLTTWQQPTGERVGIDVRLGRMAFGTLFVPADRVDVYYHYGFSAQMGGGTYRRRPWLIRRGLPDLTIAVDQSGTTPGAVTTLNDALSQWQSADRPNTVISVLDSRSYQENLAIDIVNGRWLAIEAADGARPHLRLTQPIAVTGNAPDGGLILSGLLVEGAVAVNGRLGRLRLLHTTLVPGRGLDGDGNAVTGEPSIIVEPGPPDRPINTELSIELAFSIVGPIRCPDHAVGLTLFDCIVDGLDTAAVAGVAAGTSGPPLTAERSTFLGAVAVKEATLASESIFEATLTTTFRQQGCVRFCYLAANSVTPRRYRCQPDYEIEQQEKAREAEGGVLSADERAFIRGWLVPSFVDRRYGQPSYAQLRLSVPTQIRTGAADGAEMGAFCHLKQPQREANLRLRLNEYLPFGLEPGIIYVT